jgi:hypothetical protein
MLQFLFCHTCHQFWYTTTFLLHWKYIRTSYFCSSCCIKRSNKSSSATEPTETLKQILTGCHTMILPMFSISWILLAGWIIKNPVFVFWRTISKFNDIIKNRLTNKQQQPPWS